MFGFFELDSLAIKFLFFEKSYFLFGPLACRGDIGWVKLVDFRVAPALRIVPSGKKEGS